MFIIKDDGRRDIMFNSLVVCIENLYLYHGGFGLINIKVNMVGMNKSVYNFIYPMANRETVIETLLRKYNGKWIIPDETIEIKDNRYDALDWLDSLVLMQKLYEKGN